MAKLEAQGKLGFYPLHNDVAGMIASYLSLQPEGYITVADLCAGEGEALYNIILPLSARHKKVVPYGVELSKERWHKMLKRFTDEFRPGQIPVSERRGRVRQHRAAQPELALPEPAV